MFARIFDSSALVFLLIFAGVALIVGAIAGLIKRDDAGVAVTRAFEAAILAFVGGFLARTFVSLLLSAGKDSPAAGLAVGWGFFLWPGLVDTILAPFSIRALTKPDVLLWIAAVVGAFTGMMDGVWRIHPWTSLGILSFPLDVTWGLAGSTNGCLLHLVNFAWADHSNEARAAAHRYARGFAFKSGFALTQGNVMSSLSRPYGAPLYHHERTHVWQNRIFGPLFTLTYLGWMALMALPGLIAGAASTGVGAGTGAERFSYFDNPWEVWAYEVQRGMGDDFRNSQGRLIWPVVAVIIAAVFFYLSALLAAVLVVKAVWL